MFFGYFPYGLGWLPNGGFETEVFDYAQPILVKLTNYK